MSTETTNGKLWSSFKDSVGKRLEVEDILSDAGGALGITVKDDSGVSWNTPVRYEEKHILGFDVVSYSKRSDDGRLLISTAILCALEKAVEELKKSNLIANSPEAYVFTGDGAFIVTHTLVESLAIVLATNLIISEYNAHWIVADKISAGNEPILPILCRYCLASGKVFAIRDMNNQKNVLGDGIVRASRILSASKGHHFLIDVRVMSEILGKGGFNNIDPNNDWGQAFYSAKMLPVTVKLDKFEFYNVFGKYCPVTFAQNFGISNCLTYEIGSHDTASLSQGK